jgi:hypothetical protein
VPNIISVNNKGFIFDPPGRFSLNLENLLMAGGPEIPITIGQVGIE